MDSARPAVNLENELTCSICTDLLYQPLTLLDCLHTFCGACLKEWFGWQAIRAENAPIPPEPGAAIYTCPSCRDSVRDTKHDARVTTLLEMFLSLNPDKVKMEAEREEMDRKYKKGDKVLRKLNIPERTTEQRLLDEQERRLLAEVQQMSLREAVAAAAAADSHGSSHASSRTRRRTGESSGPSRSRDPSRDSNREMTLPTTTHRSRRHTGADDPGALLQAETSGNEGRRRRSSESRQRSVEHQSSLRSLISSHDVDVRDIEREIEEFARQIQEEGLLDGLDLDNIDLSNNDELSRKITEAYRRRHRDRVRADGARRSNASSHSHRSAVSTSEAPRPRVAGDDASRPTSRHRAHSRATSTTSSNEEQRGRYPPPSSSSALLEVQEPTRRTRRRTSSGTRSATVPTPSSAQAAPPDGVRVGQQRSQTDLTLRTQASAAARPGVTSETRSSSSPTVSTSTSTQTSVLQSPVSNALPFNARAGAAGLGLGLGMADPAESSSSAEGSDSGSGSGSSSRKAAGRPSSLVTGSPVSANFAASISEPFSPGLSTPPPLSSPGSQRAVRLPRYREPLINCNGCGKEHIEYDLHYNCAVCHGGEWNICLDCWRRRKGCLHWFGFGGSAWEKWHKLQAATTPKHQKKLAPPHMLTANRYLPPRVVPGGAEGRRTLTTENPADRLQSGTFCSRCSAWTNECYWRCDVCNEGEWGFCNDCVDQGKCCTHELLPLTYQPKGQQTATPLESPSGGGGGGGGGGSRPRSPVGAAARPLPATATVLTGQNIVTIGNFRPLTFRPPCERCKQAMQPSEKRYHCYSCPSKLVSSDRAGDYNICETCYTKSVEEGVVAVENGAEGWRRCPQGHRMVVVDFVVDSSQGGGGAERRRIVHGLVGGRKLQFAAYGDETKGLQICSWVDGQKEKVSRLIAIDVGKDTKEAAEEAKKDGKQQEEKVEGDLTTTDFPPEGGTGGRATAGWSWYPAPGVADELMFPKGAEVLEIEDVNGEWFHGVYMGALGLFPAPYVALKDGL
ncbi:E3 ubiquitin-protein ligase [Diplogelasinospora grovesii]|uniref:E3 ubiquitin-protein ligase n=1 Tax=Diplogelasinospora grovesii TaxID=303347 RepID=A0AAN6NCC0_9PEZI|nr:E3 ubiquitin-protein ligase [Diplogelasinospora grovesii]